MGCIGHPEERSLRPLPSVAVGQQPGEDALPALRGASHSASSAMPGFPQGFPMLSTWPESHRARSKQNYGGGGLWSWEDRLLFLRPGHSFLCEERHDTEKCCSC